MEEKFTLFSTESKARAALQVYNIAGMGLAGYGMITYAMSDNPERGQYELGLDFAAHAIGFFALRDNASVLLRLLSAGMNMTRDGAIYALETVGESVVPPLANLVDAIGHGLTAVLSVTNRDKDAEEEKTEPTRPKMG